jgi:hypothetical protein
MICHDDTSDESTDTWKTGLELLEDDSSIFSSFNSKLENQYQVLAIIGENLEELNENNNPVLNPANVNRGANHLAEGETVDSLATREKNSTISRRVENNQNSHRALHDNTNKCQQEYAFGVPLHLKTAVEATSERED